MRFGVLHADEVLADLFDPLRFDGGVGARPQAGGFDEFGGEHPVGALLEQAGAGEDCELGAACAEVFAGAAGAPLGVLLAFFLDAHVREQAGEQALVDVYLVRGGVNIATAAGVNVGGSAHFAQLGEEVLPFADAQVVDELAVAHLAQLRGGQRRLLLVDVVPEQQEGGEVGGVVDEAGVHRIGFGAHIGGAFARVLDGQGGGEYHHFLGAVAASAFNDHAGQARVHGECRHGSADGGEGCAIAAALAGLAGAFGERAEFAQQVHAVVDGAGCGRLYEREAGDVAGFADHADCDHLQDDGCEVGAQNFGVGELGARVEVFLGVEADGDTVADAAASTGTLVGAGLRDTLDGQALNLGARGVARDAGGAGVDDVLDAGHGQRGFGDVRGEHDARPGAGGEHTVLLGEGEACVQGQHLVVQARGLGDHRLDGVLGVADFALAGEEDEDVAGGFLGELLDGVENRLGGVAVFGHFLVIQVELVAFEGAVADFDGVGAAGDLDDGRRVVGQDCFGNFAFFVAEVLVDDSLTRHVAGGEVAGEALGVDGR